jgi:hypothetical protein
MIKRAETVLPGFASTLDCWGSIRRMAGFLSDGTDKAGSSFSQPLKSATILDRAIIIEIERRASEGKKLK